MVKIVDDILEKFLEVANDTPIIAYGAGRAFRRFVSVMRIEQNVEFVVDRNVNLHGTVININGKSIHVKDISALVDAAFGNKDVVILISSLFATKEIIDELDSYKELDGIKCYIVPLLEENYIEKEVFYTRGDQRIPKIIHYFWFGGTSIPEHLQNYIDSWKIHCKDYSIVRWDESNYDVEKNKYMYQAYRNKKWGYVPDYARLDVIYQYGGIYLDTDVEVLKPFDDLLCDDSFFGYADAYNINLGHGFGAVKNNLLIKEMRDYYNNCVFENCDGTLNLKTSPNYQYPVAKKWGFCMNNTQQCINGNMIYPANVFNPLGIIGVHKHFTLSTHSAHHAQISYENHESKVAFEISKMHLAERLGVSL